MSLTKTQKIMKKLLLLLAVAVAVATISCSPDEQPQKYVTYTLLYEGDSQAKFVEAGVTYTIDGVKKIEDLKDKLPSKPITFKCDYKTYFFMKVVTDSVGNYTMLKNYQIIEKRNAKTFTWLSNW